MPTLKKTESVYVLHLGDGENRFSPSWIDEFETAIDRVMREEGPRALVTTATGKFWSTGVDLDWIAANQEQVPMLTRRVHGLLATVLQAGVPTVAAVQGHAFGAGALLAIAHDRIVVREDRGYLCWPEVNIRAPFTPGMTALLQARLPRQTAHEAMTTGRRYTGPEAVAAGIAHAAVAESDLVDHATTWARTQADKHVDTLTEIKRGLYAPALRALLSSDQPTTAA
jgi:enoyl-CoA hydratase/carnithine racemase